MFVSICDTILQNGVGSGYVEWDESSQYGISAWPFRGQELPNSPLKRFSHFIYRLVGHQGAGSWPFSLFSVHTGGKMHAFFSLLFLLLWLFIVLFPSVEEFFFFFGETAAAGEQDSERRWSSQRMKRWHKMSMVGMGWGLCEILTRSGDWEPLTKKQNLQDAEDEHTGQGDAQIHWKPRRDLIKMWLPPLGDNKQPT